MGATKEANRLATIEMLMQRYGLSQLEELQQTATGTRFRLWAPRLFRKEVYLGGAAFIQTLPLPEHRKQRIIQETENRIGYGVLDACLVAEFELDSGKTITSDRCSRWIRDETVPSHAVGLTIVR